MLWKIYVKIIQISAILWASVNSMGGAINVKDLLTLQNKYGLFLYIDDAHGISIRGKNGCGFALSHINDNLNENIIIAISMAKGYGSSGGALIVSDINIEKK